MSGNEVIYNEMWLESSLQQLSLEKAQLQELENIIINMKNCSKSEVRQEFYSILQKVRKLDDSFCVIQKALCEFEDRMAQIDVDVSAKYQNAKYKAAHIFD